MSRIRATVRGGGGVSLGILAGSTWEQLLSGLSALVVGAGFFPLAASLRYRLSRRELSERSQS